MSQAGGMAHDEKNALFSERVRDQLLHQRILVLDGVLDDDNGTLLTTQLLTLAAEDPGTGMAYSSTPTSSRTTPRPSSTVARFTRSAGAPGERRQQRGLRAP